MDKVIESYEKCPNKVNYILKRFRNIVILFLCLGLSHSATVEAAPRLPEDSTIANVSLQGLTYEEVKEKLEKEVEKWNENEVLIADSEHEKRMIPKSIFKFDIDASVNDLEQQTKRNILLFFLKSKEVHLPLTVSIDYEDDLFKEWPDHIDLDKTLHKALTIASTLDDHTIAIQYKEGVPFKQETIAEVEQDIPDLSQATLERVVKELNDQTIFYDNYFSFLENIIVPENLIDSSDEINFVSTALYGLVLQTNIEVIERHSQGKIPSYSKAGIDVSVSLEEHQDFSIYNPNDYSYTIKAEIKNQQLIMSLLSFQPVTTYKYELDHELEIEQRTIYRYSKDLIGDEQEIITEGKKGLQVDVYRTSANGSTDREFMSHEFYPPSPQIILVSTDSERSEEDDAIEMGAEFETIENELVNGEDYSGVRYIENELEESFADLLINYFLMSMFEELSKDQDIDADQEHDPILECLQVNNDKEEQADLSNVDLLYQCLEEKLMNLDIHEEQNDDTAVEELNEE